MIKTYDAILTARSLLGTPYGQMDCINFIKAIIRRSPGGDLTYTDAHVPALWASYGSSGKYKHLTWRQEHMEDPVAGMLAFKGLPLGRDHQPSHVGLVTGPTTVIHSSSALGGVVETEINNQWTLLGQSRWIEIEGEDQDGGEKKEMFYKAVVEAEKGKTVNLRAGPSLKDRIIKQIPVRTEVSVLTEFDEWSFVDAGDDSGYMKQEFLRRIDEDPEIPEEDGAEWLENAWVISESGSIICLKGKWKIAVD